MGVEGEDCGNKTVACQVQTPSNHVRHILMLEILIADLIEILSADLISVKDPQCRPQILLEIHSADLVLLEILSADFILLEILSVDLI
ncbi:hypothetical protein M8J76_004048 [Diaphorina citri]|nr:hypothetical protein M8J76_004048 [Diaphorina citri]